MRTANRAAGAAVRPRDAQRVRAPATLDTVTSNIDRLTNTGLVTWSGWSDLAFADDGDGVNQAIEALSADPTYLESPSATIDAEDVDGEIARIADWLNTEEHATGLATVAIYRMLCADEVQSTAVVVQCEDGDLLKIPEVAAILRVDPETVRRYTKDRDPGERIETIRVGKVGVRVRCEEVRAYLQRRVDEARVGGSRSGWSRRRRGHRSWLRQEGSRLRAGSTATPGLTAGMHPPATPCMQDAAGSQA